MGSFLVFLCENEAAVSEEIYWGAQQTIYHGATGPEGERIETGEE